MAAHQHIVLVAVLMGLGLWVPVRAQESARERLAADRADVARSFDFQERDCASRFAVTACMDDVRVRRREALAPLREREMQLDDAERRERAAQRQQALVARREQVQREAVTRPPVEVRARAAPMSDASVPDTPAQSSAPKLSRAAREQAAAERSKAAAARQEAVRRKQEEVAQRVAARAASGKAAAGLPVPVPAASAAKR